jgi:putative peptidoglycan lipid II flippase
VRIGLIALAVNFVLSVALAWYLTSHAYEGNHAGLALATSIAALLNAWLLYRGLRKDDVIRHSAGWGKLALQALVANLMMTVALLQLLRPLEWWTGNATALDRAAWLSVSIVAAASIYVLVLHALGLRPANLGMRPH